MNVSEAAKVAGIDAQTIRVWMKEPDCPIGTAILKPNGSNYTYIVYTKKLFELFGKEAPNEQENGVTE